MPTFHRQNGYRFFFYSWENNEPPDVHVEMAGKTAKFWFQPSKYRGRTAFDLASSTGFGCS